MAQAAVRRAQRTRYPDPAYTALRACLARWHGVAPERIVVAASASEAIQRLTACVARAGARHYWAPQPAYADYAHAAAVWGLRRASTPAEADGIVWLCDPHSPLGYSLDATAVRSLPVRNPAAWIVVDAAYAPLRLHGPGMLADAALREQVWQLWSPNKALGLTGVRAAYLVAPRAVPAVALDALQALAPSWPLGADGVALLQAWVEPATQRWVQSSRQRLARWRAALRTQLLRRGWTCLASDTPFFCARPPRPLAHTALRAWGIKLRDTSSMGLAGWWRLSAQPPRACAALARALDHLETGE
jgi:histidinol-phosphate aminotransferase